MTQTSTVSVVRADYSNSVHAQALVSLLDAYACDPMGGGEPLGEYARRNLVSALAQRPHAFSVLAFATNESSQAIGLVNCFEGFSTFACQPLVNVHDVVVLASHRSRGVASAMLCLVEEIAREIGACKLTLEVLQGNGAAISVYQRLGFANYQLDPGMGQANFMQKFLR